MSVARHPRPKELEGVPVEEIIKRYVGRFKEKKPDWAAFEDAKIEGFKRANQLTRRKHLYVEPAAGERGDRRRDALGARLKTRQGLGPDGDHLELAHALRNRGPWKGGCCSDPYAGAHNELAAIHDPLPVSSQSLPCNRHFAAISAGIPTASTSMLARISSSNTNITSWAGASSNFTRRCPIIAGPGASGYPSCAASER